MAASRTLQGQGGDEEPQVPCDRVTRQPHPGSDTRSQDKFETGRRLGRKRPPNAGHAASKSPFSCSVSEDARPTPAGRRQVPSAHKPRSQPHNTFRGSTTQSTKLSPGRETEGQTHARPLTSATVLAQQDAALHSTRLTPHSLTPENTKLPQHENPGLQRDRPTQGESTTWTGDRARPQGPQARLAPPSPAGPTSQASALPPTDAGPGPQELGGRSTEHSVGVPEALDRHGLGFRGAGQAAPRAWPPTRHMCLPVCRHQGWAGCGGGRTSWLRVGGHKAHRSDGGGRTHTPGASPAPAGETWARIPDAGHGSWKAPRAALWAQVAHGPTPR